MIRVIALCILALPALAQQDGQLSLGGTVINAKTGEPLPRAMVTIMRFATVEAAPADGKKGIYKPFTKSAFTDSGGAFHVAALSAGRYSVSAQKPEFTLDRTAEKPGEYLVELTTSTESMRLRLSPLGVITGKIVDQDGLPGMGINVTALSTQVRDGLIEIRSDRNVTTDDRGVYRLWNLAPGKYYIKVAGSGSGTSLTPASANAGMADESFAAVYFGGGKTLDSAMPVEIGPGTDAHADLSLSVEPAFKIRGTIGNFLQRRTVNFQLMSGGDEIETIRASVNNDTGKFDLAAAVPGSYVLRATQDGNTAETPVTVQSSDVDGVALTLMPPVDIPVAVHFAGGPRTAAPDGGEPGMQPWCSTRLRPAGKLKTPSAFDNVPQMGRDFIRAVPPGKYRVSFQCFGGYARSAMSGTHDLAADPILTVEPGVVPSPIEVTLFPGGGSLKGTLAFDGPSAVIVLVPQFSSVEGAEKVFAQRLGGGNKLEFQTDNLAPGSYMVWAFTRQDIEYRNPEFLRTLSGGVVVQIDDDAEKEITIDGVVP